MSTVYGSSQAQAQSQSVPSQQPQQQNQVVQQSSQRQQTVSGRLIELVEAIKAEFENAAQDSQIFKIQRDEYEMKIASQIQEMSQIQQNVYELERAHHRMKQQYEDEIMRLRRELEARGGSLPPTSIGTFGNYERKAFPPVGVPSAAKQLPVSSIPTSAHPNSSMAHSNEYNSLPSSTNMIPQKVQPKSIILFGDVDPETIGQNYKLEGPDWIAWFNPKIPRTLSINLVCNLDHPSVVCCVKYSMDGKYLATGCNKLTYIYDVTDGQKTATLADETAAEGDLYIRYVCFSPDGKFLATGAEDRQIRASFIWDIKASKIKMYLKGHEQDIYSLDYSRDGRFLASGSGDRTAKLWDVETGECLFSFAEEDAVAKDAGVTSVAISPDGRLLASGSLDRVIRIWDTSNGKLVTKLEGHKDSVYSVSFSPDGYSLISGSLDKTLKLWDLSPVPSNSQMKSIDRCRMNFVGHRDFVLSVAFSPEGNYVISGSKDRSVQFWDYRTGQAIFILQGHKNSVIGVAMSPLGNAFATGSGDFRTRIWTLEPLKQSQQQPHHHQQLPPPPSQQQHQQPLTPQQQQQLPPPQPPPQPQNQQ